MAVAATSSAPAATAASSAGPPRRMLLMGVVAVLAFLSVYKTGAAGGGASVPPPGDAFGVKGAPPVAGLDESTLVNSKNAAPPIDPVPSAAPKAPPTTARPPTAYAVVAEGSGTGPLKPAFEAWMRREQCDRPLRAEHREQRVLEPVWAAKKRPKFDNSTTDDGWPILNDAESASGPSDIANYIHKYSAFLNPIPFQLRPKKPKHLAIILMQNGPAELDKELARLFAKTHVVGGGRKMTIQACNEESWLRIVTCVAHLIQHHVGEGYTGVTLINFLSDADPPADAATNTRTGWFCTMQRVLDAANKALSDENNGGLFAVTLESTTSAVGDPCRLWTFVETMASWLSTREYFTKWSPAHAFMTRNAHAKQPATDAPPPPPPPPPPKKGSKKRAKTAAIQPDAAANEHVAKHYQTKHRLRFMHIPVSLFPFFTGIATAWRLWDVSVEDGLGLFLDLLLLNADSLKLQVEATFAYSDSTPLINWGFSNDEPHCAAALKEFGSRPTNIDAYSPRDHHNFVRGERKDTQWVYPLLDVGTVPGATQVTAARRPEGPNHLPLPLEGVPKPWRERRRQRTPAILMNMKNNDIARRSFVARYLDTFQKHYRRFAPLTMKPNRHNSFVPLVSAFCGCGNDYVGCVYSLSRSKFFTRGGGMIFMHADAYFAPKPWFQENNPRHIVASVMHPLTEGLAPQTVQGRWNKATQGPDWVFNDHSLSAVRGRRPDTGFTHLSHFQSEIASYFPGYMRARPAMSATLYDTVPNVVFGDLALYPDSVMEAQNLMLHHMFPYMILSEPATGYAASLSSHVTNVHRQGYSYVGGCCYGTDPNIISNNPAGHRVDLNRQDVMDALTARIESSFTCTAKQKPRKLLARAERVEYEVLTTTTCGVHVVLPVETNADGTKQTFLEVVDAFTNEVSITLVPKTANNAEDFVSRGGEPPDAKATPFVPSNNKYDAIVDIVLMTTNVNEVTIKGKKGSLMNLQLRVTLATGVWQETVVRFRGAEATTNDDGMADAPFELDEDMDTMVIQYAGFLDALTVDVDTSTPEHSSVAVDGGAIVVKSGLQLARTAARLDD